jgi:hypothetical protein
MLIISKRSRKLKELIVFKNGNIAAIDDGGKQIAEINVNNIVSMIIKQANDLGFSTGSVRVSWPCNNFTYVER